MKVDMNDAKQTNSMLDQGGTSSKINQTTVRHGAEKAKKHKNYERINPKFLVVLALFSILIVACLLITALFVTRLMRLELKEQQLEHKCSGYKTQLDAQDDNIIQLKTRISGLSAQIAQLEESKVSLFI